MYVQFVLIKCCKDNKCNSTNYYDILLYKPLIYQYCVRFIQMCKCAFRYIK